MLQAGRNKRRIILKKNCIRTKTLMLKTPTRGTNSTYTRY